MSDPRFWLSLLYIAGWLGCVLVAATAMVLVFDDEWWPYDFEPPFNMEDEHE